jgi:hypothetical protein
MFKSPICHLPAMSVSKTTDHSLRSHCFLHFLIIRRLLSPKYEWLMLKTTDRHHNPSSLASYVESHTSVPGGSTFIYWCTVVVVVVVVVVHRSWPRYRGTTVCTEYLLCFTVRTVKRLNSTVGLGRVLH